MSKFIDLTGQKFGRLTVIERAKNYKSGQSRWLCKCDCGNEKVIAVGNLKNGHTQSCGCLRKNANIGQIGKKYMLENELKEETQLCNLTQKTRIDNTSGIKGVAFHKSTNKWIAYIFLKNKQIYLGLFTTIEEAANARKKAEEKYFKPILEKYGRIK